MKIRMEQKVSDFIFDYFVVVAVFARLLPPLERSQNSCARLQEYK